MKLTTKTIPDFMSNPAAKGAGVLVYGPDNGLVRERCNAIIKTLLAGNDDPFALTEISEKTLKDDPVRLAEECGAMSLTGGMRVIVLSDLADKFSTVIEQAIPYLGNQTYLVATGGDAGPRTAMRQLFEQHKQLAALPCYKDEGMSLVMLIRKTLEGHGLHASRDVVDYLSRELGNDRYVTYSELEKITLYKHGESTLTLEDAERLVNHNQDHSLDDVAHALADRKFAAFDAHWQALIRDGTQPIALLRALIRYWMKLYTFRIQIDAGANIDTVIDTAKPPVFFRDKPRLKRHLQTHSVNDIIHGLAHFNAAELASKSGALPQAMSASGTLINERLRKRA